MRSIKNELAKAKIKKLPTDVSSEKRITGLLPCLSDNLPSIGEDMNCIAAKDVTKIPNAVGPAWNVST